ncbi:MAG: hypothetical protein HDR95_08235 [Bacteroides sp.]|nr:hypothetical protein [Bacteroides sp.]MBD5337276.1 hypothetical protein [Bacteroides sp.]
MQLRLLLLVIPLCVLCCCRKADRIDDVYAWPSSGVPEADSILVGIERSVMDNGPRVEKRARTDSLIRRFLDLADRHKDKEVLRIRKTYVEVIAVDSRDMVTLRKMVAKGLAETDSVKYPYEYHKFLTFAITEEADYVKKYNAALANISFFTDRRCPVDIGRNLIIAGNVMTDLEDSAKAMGYIERAERIFQDLNIEHGIRISLNNKAIVSPKSVKDSIYQSILRNPSSKNDPNSRVLMLNNLFLSTDSVGLLREAVSIYDSTDIDHSKYPMVLGLLGEYHVVHGMPREGLEYITMALDSTRKYAPDNMTYYMMFNNFLADAYYYLNEKDSCIEALGRARQYADICHSRQAHASIYATDASARIRLAEENARLERENEIGFLIILSLILAMVILWLVFRLRKRRAEKLHEEALMQERHERNLQSIRAQSKVLEEEDRVLQTIEEKIEELRTSSGLSDESAESLNRILRMHKSNEENRQGFLKMQKELDTQFVANLKRDFPGLSESQAKLASLIATGLDSRQIGNILNIEQTSVHKSRYRLRTRLGLTKDQSLEEFLRTYNRRI